MRIASLHVYPVKSTAGIGVESSEVRPEGLRDDRRWMVVDAVGHKLTARERHRLLHVHPEPDGAGGLKLTYRDESLPPLYVPRPDHGPDVPVDLSRLPRATSSTPEADAWMSAVVGEPARLVWLDDPARRPVSPDHGGLPGEPLSMADAGPVHLTTLASLDRLNDWMAESGGDPLPISRFRSNVVVEDADAPFAEDRWQRVRIGDVTFRFAEYCDRCVLPTIDVDTLQSAKEPTRTLARHRRWDGKVWFGVRLVPETLGTVTVGDRITPL
ncbi:MAG TPA: MOSC N-terminal beta barrel domain-containing protein [Nocardioidaceae bacterium]|nr:MOSC N-terminal beta barrel domain-containing protein [Nocardioidaceae bacterium]